MEDKHTQDLILESKIFKIPIDDYRNDIDKEPVKEKKKEILDLFTNSNELGSEKEFEEIKDKLHEACRKCDADLIQIYLSETIESDSKEIKFKIDKTNNTASLFKVNNKDIDELIIPRTVEHESTEYLITSITGIYRNIRTLKFVENSATKIIYGYAFPFFSNIEEIYFPSSLKELKEGWCCNTNKLTRIIISPLNSKFKFLDDKYLIGKSDSNNDEFDILLFASRDIEDISIPSNIKIISSYAFNNCKNLTKVEIETNSNLQTIEKHAFSYSKIKDISIPSKVSKICEYAFNNCHSLTKVEIETNSNLQTIESNAFSYSKIKEIFIPAKVSKICESAFHNCRNITKVEIPQNSNLQTIESNVFYNLDIENIYFPPSLKELEEGWCSQTDKLTKIIISPLNGQFKFIDDKYLIGKSDSSKGEFDTLLFASRDIKEISIPSNIKIISSHAFENCINLNKVKISLNSNLMTIKSNAFSHTKIEEIFIPSKVSKICKYAFNNCTNLTKIDIPLNSKLQTIESNAFLYTKIKNIYFPSSLKQLKGKWWIGVNKLAKIRISPFNSQFMMKKGNLLIGKSNSSNDEFDTLLFVYRDIKEITIQSNIKIISSYAFYKCKNLTKVEFEANSNLQTIEKSAFEYSNIKEIFIPPKVTKICKNAFNSCYNLAKVEIPPNSNLETIESYAFSDSNIKEIFIPPKVSKICKNVFFTCRNLTKIGISLDSNLQTIESNAFLESKIKEIYFPPSLKVLKKKWCCCANNLNRISVSPLNGQFIFKDDKFLIGKSVSNSDEFDILLFASRDITEISIPSNIKIISSYAFYKCKNLTKVEFEANSNLQTIEKYAFSYSKIKEIFIPSKVTKICKNAFYQCENLTIVEITPNSNLQTIRSEAFYNTNIKAIFIPSKVIKICYGAFEKCEKLSKIEISPNSNLQTIESNAFSNTKIKDIYIPSKVSIYGEAFSCCYYIEIIEISEELKLKSFPRSVFLFCPDLLIMIPSLKTIFHTNE